MIDLIIRRENGIQEPVGQSSAAQNGFLPADLNGDFKDKTVIDIIDFDKVHAAQDVIDRGPLANLFGHIKHSVFLILQNGTDSASQRKELTVILFFLKQFVSDFPYIFGVPVADKKAGETICVETLFQNNLIFVQA